MRRSRVECDWKNTGDYWSVAEVIDTHSSAPPTWKKLCDRFFGCGLCSFLFPDREIYRGRLDAYC